MGYGRIIRRKRRPALRGLNGFKVSFITIAVVLSFVGMFRGVIVVVGLLAGKRLVAAATR